MVFFIAVFIAKFLDLILLAVAIAGGLASRRWPVLFLAAGLAVIVQESVLFYVQEARVVAPAPVIAGYLAALVWASIAFSAKAWKRRPY